MLSVVISTSQSHRRSRQSLSPNRVHCPVHLPVFRAVRSVCRQNRGLHRDRAPVCLQNHRDHLLGHRTARLRNRRVLLRDHPTVRLRNHRDHLRDHPTVRLRNRNLSPVLLQSRRDLQDLNRDLPLVPLRNHQDLSPDRHTVRHLVVPVQNVIRFSRRFDFNTLLLDI